MVTNNSNSVVKFTESEGGIVVKEEVDEEFFIIIPVIATVIAADQIFNEGAITSEVAKEVLEPIAKVAGEFLRVLDSGLAVIFNTIGDTIYDVLQLEEVDNIAKAIITGGLSNFIDTIHRKMEDFINEIKHTFEKVITFIGIIKDGLDAIGVSDFINKFIFGDQSTSELPMISDGSLSVDEEELIKVSGTNGEHGYISVKEQELIKGSGGLQDLILSLNSGDTLNHVKKLQKHIENLRDSFESDPGTIMEEVIEDIKEILEDNTSGLREFLGKLDSLGSIQFLVTGEVEAVVGVAFEVGVSIDVKQLLFYIANGLRWDPSNTQLASFHAAYALDAGVQGGGDIGFSVAYHTSGVSGVNGFGWGFSLEGAYAYGAGVGISWPLPGSHVPNQFVAQVLGVGAKLEMAAFFNHAIIVAYLDTDLGFILAVPSMALAKATGHPDLYYSKYDWSDMDTTLFQPSAQIRWYNLGFRECSWDCFDCCDQPKLNDWSELTNYELIQVRALGYSQKTWDAPMAIHGTYYSDPYGQYFKDFTWADLLPYEVDLFTCLGWDSNLWAKIYKAPDSWNVNWDDLELEMRLCASTVGYDKYKWNKKPLIQMSPSLCDSSGKRYLPINMAGQGRTVESPAGCQQRCTNTSGCFFFTSFDDGGCHITTGAGGLTDWPGNNMYGSRYCTTNALSGVQIQAGRERGNNDAISGYFTFDMDDWEAYFGYRIINGERSLQVTSWRNNEVIFTGEIIVADFGDGMTYPDRKRIWKTNDILTT